MRARIKIPNTSPAFHNTTRKIYMIRIKEEIKFLYKKKEQLNIDLYKSHIEAANEWGNAWHTIHNAVHDSINQEMEKRYRVMDNKLNKLLDEQMGKPNDTTCYSSVIKYTAIIFSSEELQLLNKGLKYNLNHKCKQWISNLAFEANMARTMLPPTEQEYIRHQVAKNLEKLYQHHIHHYKKTNNENSIINQIKSKLTKNSAMISKADNRNSIVIMYHDDYDRKIHEFISNNNLPTSDTDITKKLRDVRNTMNDCQQLI
jgi:hypothetical protein